MPGYNSVADMAEDTALNRRLTAAVAKEGILDPKGWLYPRNWQIVSAPGWDAKWDSAIAGGVPNPGEDEAVITDGDILSAVQAVIQSEAPPAPPAGSVVVGVGSTQTVASTDPQVYADPQTSWGLDYATFSDGQFAWDGTAWIAIP